MDMDLFYARAFSLYVTMLLISACVSDRYGEPFPCGHLTCGRLGYDYCLLPPYVEEGNPECLPCEIRNDTCGTLQEQPGCQIYCQDLIRQEHRKIISELEEKYQAEKRQSKYLGVVIYILAGLSSVLFILLVITVWILIYKIRRSSKTAQDPESNAGPETERKWKDGKNSSTETSTANFDMEYDRMESMDDPSGFDEDRKMPTKPEGSEDEDEGNSGNTDPTSGCVESGMQETQGLLSGYDDQSRDMSPCKDQTLRQIPPTSPDGLAKMALMQADFDMNKK